MEEKLMNLLVFCATVILNSGLPVFLANISKTLPFMKWMDGKTNRVVAWVTVAMFVFAFGYGDVYQTDVLYELLPVYGNMAKMVFELLAFVIGMVSAIKLNKPINSAVSGVPLVGERFSEPAQ